MGCLVPIIIEYLQVNKRITGIGNPPEHLPSTEIPISIQNIILFVSSLGWCCCDEQRMDLEG